MIITFGRCHISQLYQSAGRISPAFKSSRVAHRIGLAQKRDSSWYHPCFKPLNEPCFTGLGNSGLRAGPPGNSEPCSISALLISMGRVKPSQWWQYMCKWHEVLSSWLMIGRANEETTSLNLPVNRTSVNFPFLAVHYSSYKASSTKVWASFTDQFLFACCPTDGFKSKKL